MFCRFTWQSMNSFCDSISYRVGGLFGYSVISYCYVVKGVWYIYDWDTGSLILIWWEVSTGFARMLLT